MGNYPAPHLLHFSRLGEPDIGYISVHENHQGLLPFEAQRVFWTYHTPESIVRGRHAHRRTEQVLLAVAGRLIVTTELADGTLQSFRLEDPSIGLYVPPNAWHTIQHSHGAVQLILASTPYEEEDYIRDYDLFRQHWRSQP